MGSFTDSVSSNPWSHPQCCLGFAPYLNVEAVGLGRPRHLTRTLFRLDPASSTSRLFATALEWLGPGFVVVLRRAVGERHGEPSFGPALPFRGQKATQKSKASNKRCRVSKHRPFQFPRRTHIPPVRETREEVTVSLLRGCLQN